MEEFVDILPHTEFKSWAAQQIEGGVLQRKFTTKMETINRDEKKLTSFSQSVIHSPGFTMAVQCISRDNTALVPRAAGNFTAGITVAVEALLQPMTSSVMMEFTWLGIRWDSEKSLVHRRQATNIMFFSYVLFPSVFLGLITLIDLPLTDFVFAFSLYRNSFWLLVSKEQ